MQKITRDKIRDALIDILDGEYSAKVIHINSGLRMYRCKEILNIVNSLRKEYNENIECRVVCGVCIVKCKNLKEARKEAKAFNRGVVDELIDVKVGECWTPLVKKA